MSPAQLVTACTNLRPDVTKLADPVQAAKAALRSIALRAHHLELESRTLRKRLDDLTVTVAPATSAVFGPSPAVPIRSFQSLNTRLRWLRGLGSLIEGRNRNPWAGAKWCCIRDDRQ